MLDATAAHIACMERITVPTHSQITPYLHPHSLVGTVSVPVVRCVTFCPVQVFAELLSKEYSSYDTEVIDLKDYDPETQLAETVSTQGL